MARCEFCGEAVDEGDRYNTYRKVSGYERLRTQGGTNALRLRQPLEQYAHLDCIKRESKGTSARQGTLA